LTSALRDGLTVLTYRKARLGANKHHPIVILIFLQRIVPLLLLATARRTVRAQLAEFR
jgi:hypothetical protein